MSSHRSEYAAKREAYIAAAEQLIIKRKPLTIKALGGTNFYRYFKSMSQLLSGISGRARDSFEAQTVELAKKATSPLVDALVITLRYTELARVENEAGLLCNASSRARMPSRRQDSLTLRLDLAAGLKQPPHSELRIYPEQHALRSGDGWTRALTLRVLSESSIYDLDSMFRGTLSEWGASPLAATAALSEAARIVVDGGKS